MLEIAIIGFGVVGGGVAEVIDANAERLTKAIGQPVHVKYILDLREFPDSPYGDRVVHDIQKILEDPEVSLVVETMGGSHPAYEFSVAAMKAGKHVVTSNKEVVATYGIELQKAAAEAGVFYLFEASVGGGIPCLRSIRTSLSGDQIDRIDGIMNGTTNFILTKMKNEHLAYDVVLKEAQALGYAEKNPSADVDGIDTQRKITILTALASGILLKPEQVYAETMTKVSAEDMADAEKAGCAIRLIGSFRKLPEGRVAAWVCPCFVPFSKPLSRIDGVYNAISVNSPITNDVMYYGQGAGRYPTAGAVISDIVSAGNGAAAHEAVCDWKSGEGCAEAFENLTFSSYVRVASENMSEAKKKIQSEFGEVKTVSESAGVWSFITSDVKESKAKAALTDGAWGRTVSRIRILK